MTRKVLGKFGFVRTALVVGVGIPFIAALSAYGQDAAIPQSTATTTTTTTTTAATTQEAERVIVTGSNIPTAEEVGPNPC